MRLILRRFPRTKEVLIISKDSEVEMKEQNKIIKVLPFWKFLIS